MHPQTISGNYHQHAGACHEQLQFPARMKSSVQHPRESWVCRPVDCLEHGVINTPHGTYRLVLRSLRLICYALNRSLVNKLVLVLSTLPVQHEAPKNITITLELPPSHPPRAEGSAYLIA
jgi:hypothetical protein